MFRTIFLLLLALTLTGCAGRGPSAEPGQPQRMIRIDWFGHQMFRVRSAVGITIVTNPFSAGSTGFTVPKGITPEILLVTNESERTNNVDLVDNSPSILRGSVGIGTNTSSGVRILGVPVFSNPERQDIAGMNVVYRWQMDGLKFCFLGEIQRPLSREDATRIGPVDVLFLPVSGTDLTGTGRAEIIAQLRPRVIIPMGTVPAVREFAGGFTSVYPLNGNAALLSREALPAQQTVLLFRAP